LTAQQSVAPKIQPVTAVHSTPLGFSIPKVSGNKLSTQFQLKRGVGGSCHKEQHCLEIQML
jgi:hypothetical protein